MKNRVRRWTGEWAVESALHSHCRTDILDDQHVSNLTTVETCLMAPSKVPGLNPNPCPISCRNKSPSTSRSSATSVQSAPAIQHCGNSPSMLGATSTPTQTCPSSSRSSPLSPLPHPISRTYALSPSGSERSWRARSVISAWTFCIRELVSSVVFKDHI